MRFTVDRIDHVVLNTADVEITASWYQRVLGMDRHEFGEEGRTALTFGGQKINLRPAEADTRAWITARVPDAGAADLCFITAMGVEHIVEHLHDCRVMIEAGPTDRAGALGMMRSVYCRDPDGNLIEIASYLDR